MTEQLGEQMSELSCGDSVVVTIDGVCYEGIVTDTKRWMCEFKQGFMESGSIAIHLVLSNETVRRYDLPAEKLLITATEDVPQAWNIPKASVYDPIEEETIANLGDVLEIEANAGAID